MDETTKVIRIIVDSSKAIDGSAAATRALAAIEQQTASVKDKIGSMEDAIDSLIVKFFSIEAASAVFSKAIDGIHKLSEEMNTLSNRASTLKTTTDWLQAFNYAAASSGVNIESANTALDRFSKTVGEAALGNLAAVTTLKDLGIKIYDVQGNVRPLNDLFVETAKKLSGMDGSAKSSALAIQAMGRNAQQIAPMLGAVAQGSDAMAASVQKANASVTPENVAKWKELADTFQKNIQQWTAFAANNFADPVKSGFEAIASAISGTLPLLQQFLTGMGQAVTLGKEALRTKAVADASTSLQDNLAAQADQTAKLADAQKRIAANQNIPIRSGVTSFLYAPVDAASASSYAKATADADQAQRFLNYYKGNQGSLEGRLYSLQIPSPDGTPPPTSQDFGAPPATKPGPTTGSAYATAKGAGDSLDNRLAKLTADAQIALAGAKAAAGAADMGADAVARLEDHTKNLKEVTDAYIKSQKDGTALTDAERLAIDQKVTALDKLTESTRVYNNLKTFALQTVGIKESNDLAELQLQLSGQTTEEIARQVDQQKAFNDERDKGLIAAAAGSDDLAVKARQEIADRATAIDQTYKIKVAQDEVNKSTQLWLAPFSQAISSVQSSFEGFFETIFKGGALTWQSMADSFKSIFAKMLAELAVLAVVRPIIAPIVQSIFSPGAAQSLGYGGSSGGLGGLSSIFGAGGGLSPGIQGGGGGGGISLPGMSGAGGLFGSSSWLNTPFIGGPQTLPAFEGVDVGSAAGGYGFADLAGAGGGLGANAAGVAPGLTPLGAFGGAASIGLGAYNLFTAKTTGQAVGGGLGILGGGLGLASALIPGMAALGPVGLGVGLLAAILPSLLGGGDSTPKIPPQPALIYNYGGFSPNASGGYTSDRTTGASTIATSVLGLIHQAGLTTVAGNMWGGDFAEGVNHVLVNGQWQAQPYTNAGLSGPNGQYRALEYDHNMSSSAAAELLAVATFSENVHHGGVANASDSLKAGLDAYGPTTIAQAQNIIALSTAYDKLGKSANPVKDSIDKVTASFDQLTQFAGDAGLSLAPINAEMAKQTQRTAQDFIDNMLDPLAVQMRALQDSEDSAMASAQYINDNVQGVYADTAKIAAYYLDQRAKLDDQYYNGAVTNLKALIANLTYGDLANASPDTSLSGTRASYNATLAQAQGGDATAIGNLSSVAQAYATSARSYFASGPEYAALVAQIRQDLAGELDTITGGSSSSDGTAAANSNSSALAQQYSQLVDMFNQSQQSNAALMDKLTVLTAQLARQNAA